VSDWAVCCVSVCAAVVLVAAISLANNVIYLRWGRWLEGRHKLSGLHQGRRFMDARPNLSSFAVRFRIDWRCLRGRPKD
jgi:hypothetical protein